jgi:hypothetical protein
VEVDGGRRHESGTSWQEEPCPPTDIKWVVNKHCLLPKDDTVESCDTPPELEAEALHVLDYLCRERPALVCDAMGWRALRDEYMGAEPVPEFPLVELVVGEPIKIRGEGRAHCAVVTVCGGESGEWAPDGRTLIRPQTLWHLSWIHDEETWGWHYSVNRTGDPNVPTDKLDEIEAAADRYIEEHGEQLIEGREICRRNAARHELHIDADQSKEYVRPKGGFGQRGAA